MLQFKNTKPPILVTGSHRSGTTIVGKLLSVNKNIGYIPEPFNAGYGLEGVKRRFPYIHAKTNNVKYYDALINDLLQGRANFKRSPIHEGEFILKKLGKKVFRSKAHLLYQKSIWNPLVDRFLIKDPLAVLASQWLSKSFDMSVVMLVRHPAAFVSSLKRQNWAFNFNNFFLQQELMDEHLDKILKSVDIEDKTFIEQSAYLWVCIYEVVRLYLERDSGFYLVKHEEISERPFVCFRKLYKRLELKFSNKVRAVINEHMGEVNPAEANKGQTFQLKRNSKDIIDIWKSRLTSEELSSIEKIARPLAEEYYSYTDWSI